MEIPTSNSPSSLSNGGRVSRILQSPTVRFIRYPITSILEFSGVLLTQPDFPYSPIPETTGTNFTSQNPRSAESVNRSTSSNCEEVSIWIDWDQDGARGANSGDNGVNRVGLGAGESMVGAEDVNGNSNGGRNNSAASSTDRHDLRQIARWLDRILPFSLLWLVVFIHQHSQEFALTVYSTAFLLRSDDVLQKQTALKGKRKITVLVGYSVFFLAQIFAIYWCEHSDDFLYPLLMIPPKTIPPFWHAVFVILLNDTMTRLAAMVVKLVVLMYYKNVKGRSFRKQGQMLTLVEYTLLLYRSLLPTPVWYRFFLNKEYGSLFSPLTTGLYLTFKLVSIVEKVQHLFAALKAFSRKELHYGSYATYEQVFASGDICAICQEKMCTPILLRCKHIFCEECVSDWFEVERTCPLCRAVVRPFELQSYGDGSTDLHFQLF